MTKDELIFEITERFQNELEELSFTQLSKLFSATECSPVLNTELMNEDLEMLMDDDEEDADDANEDDLQEIDEDWQEEE